MKIRANNVTLERLAQPWAQDGLCGPARPQDRVSLAYQVVNICIAGELSRPVSMAHDYGLAAGMEDKIPG